MPVVTIPHLHREISPVRDLLATFRLARMMRAERPTILHTHTAKAGAVGRTAALLAGRARPPIIVHTFHGHVLRGYFGRFWTGVFRLLERSLARITDALVAVSPEVRDELVALGVAPAEKFRVIRLGIDLEARLTEDGSARAETRRVMGVSDDRFLVGWIGRMTGVKRTDVVLQAIPRAARPGVDATLCMVGDGPDRDSVEELAPSSASSALPVHRLPGGRRAVLRRVRRLRAPLGERGDAGDGDRGALRPAARWSPPGSAACPTSSATARTGSWSTAGAVGELADAARPARPRPGAPRAHGRRRPGADADALRRRPADRRRGRALPRAAREKGTSGSDSGQRGRDWNALKDGFLRAVDRHQP